MSGEDGWTWGLRFEEVEVDVLMKAAQIGADQGVMAGAGRPSWARGMDFVEGAGAYE